MGLLSDPSLTHRNKLGRSLVRHSRKICFIFYIAGLIWFICLAHPDFNHGTYLSENALSPGLVYPEIKQDTSRLAQTLLEELNRELIEHKSLTPHAWIVGKMNQIGLETHVHNFTLRYPFSGGKEYHGKNVYGILRAPRIGSTEGIVFSAPYRAPTSVHTDIVASVPVLLAFADFARKNNYWAKDLVFLVTEQEQLGMHAWLEAYYKGDNCDPSILNCGNLPARAGALQAAINLEIQDLDIDYIDVKIEGLNGQLPNLDMFNLVQRITSREGISSGYKQSSRKKRHSTRSKLEENLRHMATMLASQASGVPNGNHGLFHRYRIESLTLEAISRSSHLNHNRNSASLPLLKTIEGISRSLNNLLERFHQSFFFYILVQNDRFVSIGDFMPCLILLASPMFIKAFLLWLSVDGDNSETQESNEHNQKWIQQLPYGTVLLLICGSLSLGLLGSIIPMNQYVRDFFAGLNISTAITIGIPVAGIVAVSAMILLVVILPDGGLELLHIAAIIYLGVALIVVGLLNFALGFMLAIVCVPLAILITIDDQNAVRKTLTLIYTFMLNPLVAIYLIIFFMTLCQFPELSFNAIFMRAIGATMDAITYALMDCIIYQNWLFTTVAAIFFPLWLLFWTLALCRRPTEQHQLVKKLN